MMQIILSFTAGLFIELFFQLVKYRDSLNTESPRPVTAYGNLTDASNYMTVSQYLSGGSRKWLNYFLFRLLPPFIIFLLLSGFLSRYNGEVNYLPYILIAAATSLLLRDTLQLFKSNLISEKLLHLTNIFLVLVVASATSLLAQKVDLSFLAPNIDGLVDNLWSSLLVAMLVIFYFRITNMSTKYQDSRDEEVAIDNYILRSYQGIKAKQYDTIEDACQNNQCSKQILYAILIHENMNRPTWLRAIENIIVRFFKIDLTVGIAQVRSKKPLTDNESIVKAAAILENSVYVDSGRGDGFTSTQQLEELLDIYNSSPKYAESISIIISRLRIYANELFGGKK